MRKNRTIITESDLHRIVKESVKMVVNEIKNGWSLEEDDITVVNDENGGKTKYLVGIWPGSGYLLLHYAAYADSGEEALEYVVAYCEENGDNIFCDEYVKREREELAAEGRDEEEIDYEIGNWALYVDATMVGAQEPHYLFLENLKIKKYDGVNFA